MFSQDFTVFGGSLGEVYGEKIVKLMDHALKTGCPLIGINDGGGARIQEGVVALGLFAEIFFRNVPRVGRDPADIPDHGAVRRRRRVLPRHHRFHADGRGHLAHVHHRAGCDQDGDREEVSFEELGGASAHNTKSGVAHYQAKDEDDCLDFARDLLSYLPSNNLDDPPVVDPPGDPMAGLEITESDLNSTR